MNPHLPPQQIATDVLLEKYAKGDERSVTDIHHRVARAVAGADAALEPVFFQALQDGFVPAGRIMSAAGTDLKATLINCFVQPVGDTVSGYDGATPGIYTALQQATETMRLGGGVGYDFSGLRPRGAKVRSTGAESSGVVSYMNVFDASCKTVASAGDRRGAQMGVLDISHPDILEFISAKKTQGALTNFNISVGVSDAFMEAVVAGLPWDLVHKAEPSARLITGGARQREDCLWVYRTVAAVDLWTQIMRNTYDGAEPGILFLSRINRENNLWYCEDIRATNPCGEQPLPPYACCCLGSLNLTSFVQDAFEPTRRFDMDAFERSVGVAIRMLDRVLDLTTWPLEEQRLEAQNKRRVGLGFLGLGSALVMLGIPYDTQAARDFAALVMRTLRDAAYRASIALAQELGAFPLFDAEKYLASGMAQRLPEDIRQAIRAHGIRNSHLLSIAPTGTITLAFADNASNGIEPAFAWFYDRRKKSATHPDGWESYRVQDHAYRVYQAKGGDVEHLPPEFVSALTISADDHMKMLAAVQPYCCSAISKTVNVPEDYPFGDFEDLYLAAWRAGLKGLATYRPNSTLGAVLSLATDGAGSGAGSGADASEPAAKVPDVNPLDVRIPNRPNGELQGVNLKVEYLNHEGRQSVYINVGFESVQGVIDGQAVVIERPIEIFMPASQSTDGQQWISSHMRNLSLALRYGVPVSAALANMIQVTWDKGPVRCGFIEKADGTRAPRFFDSEVAAIGYEIQQLLIRRGFLDANGRERRLQDLVIRPARATPTPPADAAPERPGAAESQSAHISTRGYADGTGKKCPHCGAHDVHKVDGCERCANCDFEGSCG